MCLLIKDIKLPLYRRRSCFQRRIRHMESQRKNAQARITGAADNYKHRSVNKNENRID